MAFLLTVLIVFVVLIGSEFWWRQYVLDGEFSRKFVHITVGSFVAFWPFYLDWRQIEILSGLFLIVIALSKVFGIFEAIHSVQRPTWGELYFAAAVGLIAMITHDQWIYTASLLQMSLADGLAAVVGIRFGGKYKYLVFGHTKSLIGTATFFGVSLGILFALNPHFSPSLNPLTIFGLSLTASVLENIGIKGSDNLLVPLLIALVLINA